MDSELRSAATSVAAVSSMPSMSARTLSVASSAVVV